MIGSLVISPGSQSPVYSNPIPRGGLAAVFSAEVLELDAAGDIEILLQHKNGSETSFSTLQTMGSIGSTGIQTVNVTGIRRSCASRRSSRRDRHPASSSGSATSTGRGSCTRSGTASTLG